MTDQRSNRPRRTSAMGLAASAASAAVAAVLLQACGAAAPPAPLTREPAPVVVLVGFADGGGQPSVPLRSAPYGAAVRTVPHGSRLELTCGLTGTPMTAAAGTSTTWLRTVDQLYVNVVKVRPQSGVTTVPSCAHGGAALSAVATAVPVTTTQPTTRRPATTHRTTESRRTTRTSRSESVEERESREALDPNDVGNAGTSG